MRRARRNTIDGPEQLCRRCDEWWPHERGFWYRMGKPQEACKACTDEWNRRWFEAMDVERRRAYWRDAKRKRAAA